MNSNWFVIINPTSGKGKGLKQLTLIKALFYKYNLEVHIVITEYIHHEKKLVQNAIKQGFKKILCIGGDGTLHQIVNGIMCQKVIEPKKIKVAIIPVGTGNDWVKTYKIPNKIESAIQIIQEENTTYQDIGCINFINRGKRFYFNNVAGIGFDAFVVNKINNIKIIGGAAYLVGGLLGFLRYKKNVLQVKVNDKIINSKIFMISVGLCQFSGGGMQLTNFKNHKKGLFDITLIKNISLLKILFHIKKLYNTKITRIKEVQSYTSNDLEINIKGTIQTLVQADGELIGSGDIKIQLIKNGLQFVIPKKN